MKHVFVWTAFVVVGGEEIDLFTVTSNTKDDARTQAHDRLDAVSPFLAVDVRCTRRA